MNVVDLPKRAERADYDEAVARYAQMVKPRAIAVYQVGSVRYPGLSDVDLLVVTDRCSLDNRYFYSAMQRMPRRYLNLFLHEPFILPAWSLRVMRHTTHHAPHLIAGRDVVRQFVPSDEPDERWCRVLSGYCASAAFLQRTRADGTLKARMTIAVTSAFRFQLADAREAFGFEDGGYAARVDALRAGFFERAQPERAVEEAFDLFCRAFEAFETRVRSHLNLGSGEDAPAAARAALCGDREMPALNREYAFARTRAIAGYHEELASMGFPYGDLFFVAAHPHSARLRAGGSLVGGMVRNLYRVRRRIEEYARA